MTQKKVATKTGRKGYSAEFKQQALLRAVKGGVPMAAQDGGLDAPPLCCVAIAGRATGTGRRGPAMDAVRASSAQARSAAPGGGSRVPERSGGVLREAAEVKYAMIRTHEGAFTLRWMCRVLCVSPSGDYAWRDRRPSARAPARATRDGRVRDAFEARRARAGAPRLARHWGKGRRQVAGSLRRQGLRAKAAKKFKATSNSNHSLPVAENLLQPHCTAPSPNPTGVADMTYIATDEGWLYLAGVLDLYSRKVVGWSMSGRMTATLVCDARSLARFARQMPHGVIMPTDCGSQYGSREHRQLLA